MAKDIAQYILSFFNYQNINEKKFTVSKQN